MPAANESKSIRVKHTRPDGATQNITVHYTSPIGRMLCFSTLRKVTTENHLGEINIYEKVMD